jgi:hypothetical protein
MMIALIAVAIANFWIGRLVGYKQGEKDMYHRCRDIDRLSRRLFSEISAKK